MRGAFGMNKNELRLVKEIKFYGFLFVPCGLSRTSGVCIQVRSE